MKIELIKLPRIEKYVIRRKGLFFYEYLDLNACRVSYWWRRDSEYFRHCIGTKEEAEKAFNDIERLNNKSIILKTRILK